MTRELTSYGFERLHGVVDIPRLAYIHRGRWRKRTYLKDEDGTVWHASGHVRVPGYTRHIAKIKGRKIVWVIPAH